MTAAARQTSPPSAAHPPGKKPRVGNAPDRGAPKRERKRLHNLQKAYAKQLEKNGPPPITFDIAEMLGAARVDEILHRNAEFDRVPPFGQEVQVTIERLSAHGDGLARTPQGDRLLVIPFALPGEVVRVLPYASERLYFKARILELLKRNEEMRHDELVGCRYFGACGGCQYQMIPYEKQLQLKQRVLENAFAHYSGLDAALVPPVQPTMGSPLKMRYRTKLTPHYDLPQAVRKKAQSGEFIDANDLPIGFDNASTGRVMDIEECPIGTDTINAALPRERQAVRDGIAARKNGATILLRDSLASFDSDESVVVTDHKATVHEVVGPTKFDSPAGAFFQNNRSIIPSVIDYIRYQPAFTEQPGDEPRYLVDTYCGSGLFALTLAPLFHQVAGVEISAQSIECAKENARLNGVENATFLAGSAENIFANISYPREQTTVVIDPPRRGCDEAFIKQLVQLRPAHILYVSCNVHTQARDIGQLIRMCPSYRLQSVKGFDFFPQTHHVEGICVLRDEEA